MIPENSKPLYSDDDDDDESSVYHFAWIKNMSRVLSTQLSKKKNKKFICYRRLNNFGKQGQGNTCKTELLGDEEQLKCKNYRFKKRVLFAVYEF